MDQVLTSTDQANKINESRYWITASRLIEERKKWHSQKTEELENATNLINNKLQKKPSKTPGNHGSGGNLIIVKASLSTNMGTISHELPYFFSSGFDPYLELEKKQRESFEKSLQMKLTNNNSLNWSPTDLYQKIIENNSTEFQISKQKLSSSPTSLEKMLTERLIPDYLKNISYQSHYFLKEIPTKYLLTIPTIINYTKTLSNQDLKKYFVDKKKKIKIKIKDDCRKKIKDQIFHDLSLTSTSSSLKPKGKNSSDQKKPVSSRIQQLQNCLKNYNNFSKDFCCSEKALIVYLATQTEWLEQMLAEEGKINITSITLDIASYRDMCSHCGDFFFYISEQNFLKKKINRLKSKISQSTPFTLENNFTVNFFCSGIEEHTERGISSRATESFNNRGDNSLENQPAHTIPHFINPAANQEIPTTLEPTATSTATS